MFKTIKGKLLTILLSFIFVIIGVSVIAFNYFVKTKDSLSSISQKSENIHRLLLQDINIMHNFFENETINPDFFYTGRSELVRQHHLVSGNISRSCEQLRRLQEQNGFSLNDSITSLELNFSTYNAMVDNIINQVLKRGFKDFGIEGKMRKYAHILESRYKSEAGLINILQLRRHEKDFIIRQEDQYIKKHYLLIADIKKNVSFDKHIDVIKRNEIMALLDSYSLEFKNLVVLEKKLGLRNDGGLKREINEISARIEESLGVLVRMSKEKVSEGILRMQMFYLVVGLMFIIVSIISAIIISKKVSHSMSDLKNKIQQFVDSEFTERTVLPVSNSVNEIDVLITNISIMEQHIVNQMAQLKQSNKDLEMLFYATSHDIRAPLIVAKRLTDVALTKTSDPEAVAYFLMIRESWEKLHNIIDELGMVTNIRNIEIGIEITDLEYLVRSVYSEFKALEDFDNIVFSLDMKLKGDFYSSPSLVKAIFRNIIENSIKYSTKRTGFSFLKIAITDQNEEMIRIEIADNGIGIKKEHQQKIFDMFFRGTTHKSGTGLGLYIVQCSLEKLNGAISVESDENKGTTFTIILPNLRENKHIREKIIQRRDMFRLHEVIA